MFESSIEMPHEIRVVLLQGLFAFLQELPQACVRRNATLGVPFSEELALAQDILLTLHSMSHAHLLEILSDAIIKLPLLSTEISPGKTHVHALAKRNVKQRLQFCTFLQPMCGQHQVVAHMS